MKVFAVFDKAVSAFERPFFARSGAEAIRSFQDAVNDSKSPFFSHADDFELHQLGDFADDTGLFSGGPPVPLASAADLKMKQV